MAQPKFPFNDQVPQASQKIAATQQPILSNFQAVNELVVQNHVGFSDIVNYGKHTVVTFPVQTVAPVTAAAQMSIYAATSTTPNGLELFYQYPSAGTTGQLTGNVSTAVTNGYTQLPGGLIMKWGLNTGTVPGANTITFPTGIAFTTSVQKVGFSTASNYTIVANGPYISNITLLDFVLNVQGSISLNVYWFAIGS